MGTILYLLSLVCLGGDSPKHQRLESSLKHLHLYVVKGLSQQQNELQSSVFCMNVSDRSS